MHLTLDFLTTILWFKNCKLACFAIYKSTLSKVTKFLQFFSYTVPGISSIDS